VLANPPLGLWGKLLSILVFVSKSNVPSDILYGINKRFDYVKSNSVRQDDIESGFESRNVGMKLRQ